MTWTSKKRDWKELERKIQLDIDSNKNILEEGKLEDIQHYLDHGEYSMAFEYLYLEVMENKEMNFTLGIDDAKEIATFFELYDPNECMVDPDFWSKFMNFLWYCQIKKF